MLRKLLKCYVKDELLTNSVDNFVENKKIHADFDYKNSIFVKLANF